MKIEAGDVLVIDRNTIIQIERYIGSLRFNKQITELFRCTDGNKLRVTHLTRGTRWVLLRDDGVMKKAGRHIDYCVQ